jgi:hypothetical protein
MKKNQKGFALVEGLLILIIVILVGFIGWYVYHTDHKSNTANTSSAAKTTDSTTGWQTYQGDGYTLKYPTNWKFVAKDATYATDEFLPAANYPDNNAYILMFESSKTNMAPEQYAKTQGPADILTANSSTINGYSAYTENYNVPGPSGVPDGYQVFVGHSGLVVTFNYESGEPYTQTYKTIINTIKFTN